MTEPNAFSSDFDFSRAGVGMLAVGRQAGSEELGVTVYELEPGARWADLHIHYANEELIIVLEGKPTLHTLDESRELEPGAVYACPRGRRGAHRLENGGREPARVVIVSTMQMPEVVEYPEQGRVFLMTEPPYTDAPFDDSVGRLLRVFSIAEGSPVPPDGAE